MKYCDRNILRSKAAAPCSGPGASYNSPMVAVLHAAPQAAAPQAVAGVARLLVPDYSADERASFADAVEYARERTGDAAMADGEPALDRALGTATILAGLKLDAD